MSLINDALKRAAESKPPSPTPPGQDLQLQPVSNAQSRPRYARWLPLAAVLTLLVAGLFLVRAWNRTERLLNHPGSSKNPIPVAAREPSQALTDSSQSQANALPSVIPFPSDPGSTLASGDGSAAGTRNAGSAAPAAVPGALQQAPQPPATPTFPTLKLQGIYYRPANPSVVINFQTLYTGDSIDEARVVEITRSGAKVQWRDETRVLTFK